MQDDRVIRTQWLVPAVVLLLSFFFPSAGVSQQARMTQAGRLTTLNGTATNAEGEPLSGPTVVARNLATGQTQSDQSDAQGGFEIRLLSPGAYSVQASRAGFVTQARESLDLSAGQLLTLLFALEPEAPEAAEQEQAAQEQGEEEQNEAAPASTVEEASSEEPENTINEDQLLGLPLNGRSYSQLATLQAGVSDSSSSSASRGVGGGSLSISGSRATSNHFLLDGTSIMNAENQVPRSAAGVQLGSDTVFQVQVLSVGYGAEYGRSSGGVLNSITRSGTSEFHGTLFEFFRNSKLDARNFFDRDSEPPPFKRNQFGFTLTGPLQKDRAFFLFSYEGLRDRLTETNVSFFPNEEARSGFPDSSGTPTVPIAPSVQPYLELYPVPNDIGLGRGVGRNVAPQFLPVNENFFTFRVDQKISDKDSFFARYTFDDATGEESQGTHLFQTAKETRQQYLTVVGTHIVNLQALAAFRFGYTRAIAFSTTRSLIDIPSSLSFFPEAPRLGQILIPGLSVFGPNVTIPRADNMDSFQFGSQMIVQRGSHALKFGVDVHRYRLDIFSDWQKGGQWTFNSLEGFLQAGPEGTGLTVTLPGSDNRRAFRQNLIAFYGQDEFRLNPRLQLNMGLRYEFASKINDLLEKTVFLRDVVRGTEVEYGDFFEGNPSLLNFAPRLGLTWSPWEGRETVVRSGIGIYYDPILGYVANSRRSSAPYYRMAVSPNLDTSAFFPNALEGPEVPFLVQVMDHQDMNSGMVFRYHVTLEQPLPGGWRTQVSYVGSRGNHLLRRFEANQYPVPAVQQDGSLLFPKDAGPINPAFGAITIINTDAQSFYNALQVSANKSLSSGLSLQASYTFSKSVDDSSVGQQTNTGQYPLRRTLDRSLSDFDIRHRLVFSYFYTLPFGSGQRWGNSGPLSKLLGGWRLGGIMNFRKGTPFSVESKARAEGYLFAANRPNLDGGARNNPVAGVSAGCGRINAGQTLGTPELYFDPCAFSAPPPGTLGNAGRNTLIAPSVFNMDISVQREFILDSVKRLQFRADIFNLPNHPNFTSPSPVVFSGRSGNRTSTAGRISRTATTSRQIQFALRFSF